MKNIDLENYIKIYNEIANERIEIFKKHFKNSYYDYLIPTKYLDYAKEIDCLFKKFSKKAFNLYISVAEKTFKESDDISDLFLEIFELLQKNIYISIKEKNRRIDLDKEYGIKEKSILNLNFYAAKEQKKTLDIIKEKYNRNTKECISDILKTIQNFNPEYSKTVLNYYINNNIFYFDTYNKDIGYIKKAIYNLKKDVPQVIVNFNTDNLFKKEFVLIHEIGHLIHLHYGLKEKYKYIPSIFSESTGITFEFLYLEYMKKNKDNEIFNEYFKSLYNNRLLELFNYLKYFELQTYLYKLFKNNVHINEKMIIKKYSELSEKYYGNIPLTKNTKYAYIEKIIKKAHGPCIYILGIILAYSYYRKIKNNDIPFLENFSNLLNKNYDHKISIREEIEILKNNNLYIDKSDIKALMELIKNKKF